MKSFRMMKKNARAHHLCSTFCSVSQIRFGFLFLQIFISNYLVGLSHIVPEKRSIDYRPRMGRRSNENDQQKPYEPKPYDVFYTPRMGKRSEAGRSMFFGKFHSAFSFRTIRQIKTFFFKFLQNKEYQDVSISEPTMMTT